MNTRSYFVKMRLNAVEYGAIRKRADAQGVTMSEHVRATVMQVHEAQDVAAELAALRQQLRPFVGATTTTATGTVSTEQREMLLLLRELAAARDAQILARVRAQLATQANGTSQRGGAE